MISFGKNLTSAADELQKISLKMLYDATRNPKPETAARIRQLRIVRDLDSKQYAALKRSLPYVVCAMFNPPYRKTENFTYTEYFILDIDHVSELQMSLSELKKMVNADERVLLSYVSPGEDGLKVFFRLSERCYDYGLYSAFYKIFARDFACRYNLQQVMDTRTSDVTRACFVSHDPDAFFNENTLPVDLNAVLNTENADAYMQQLHEIKKLENEREEPVPDALPPHDPDPDKDAMLRIKSLLSNKPPKPEKEVFVPEALNNVIADIQMQIENTGVTVTEIINISYGKKIRMKLGAKMAEINVFYGKRGFTVVVSPRTGTHAELNEMMAEYVENYLNTL